MTARAQAPSARARSPLACAPAPTKCASEPFPVPAGARAILVYGGAFDPPHKAHFELPPLLRDTLGADFLLYVPAARSPHKDAKPGASGPDRVAMLRAGLRGVGRAGVSTIELDRATDTAGPSYTIDTLRDFASRAGAGATFRLLIGADQAREFHGWREPREIIRLAEPAVMLRGGTHADRAALLEAMRPHWSEGEMRAWESRLVEAPIIEASATEARRIIREEGVGAESLRRLVPPEVIEVIRARGLYLGVQ